MQIEKIIFSVLLVVLVMKPYRQNIHMLSESRFSDFFRVIVFSNLMLYRQQMGNLVCYVNKSIFQGDSHASVDLGQ